jgi:signal transduction histidine kinase
MKRFVLMSAVLLAALAIASPAVAGDKGTPAEAQALLDKAVKEVEKDGTAKALAVFNDPKGAFIDRDLYVFCQGPDGKVTAHRDPAMLGREVAGIKDADGKEIGKQMLEIGKKGSGQLEYRWMNPVSNKVETKISYMKKAGNQMCGVGAYK